MIIRICGLALAAFAAWGLGAASAQENTADPGLTLGQFLEDAARNHPRLEEARAELDAAEARGRANSRPLYTLNSKANSPTVRTTRMTAVPSACRKRSTSPTNAPRGPKAHAAPWTPQGLRMKRRSARCSPIS